MTTEPTDDEIIALLGDRKFSSVEAVREALRRWGQPSGAGDGFVVTSKLGDICQFRSTTVRKGDTVYTAPQPTQAQAGAVPLTSAQIEAAAPEYSVDDFLDFNAGVRFAEQHHGIKGGQHG